MTLVSVITPTWQRHHLLLSRAIPSVRAQTYTDFEHIIASDGPDRDLRQKISEIPGDYRWDRVRSGESQPQHGGFPWRYVEVPHHDEHKNNFGSRARNHGLARARGDYIAYLDDDNAWRPEHLALLCKALDDNPRAGFAYSKLVTHPQGQVIGTDPPTYGGIDTSVIVHRRELLDIARWPKPNQITFDQHAPDWDIVANWLRAGTQWVHVPEVTVDYHCAGS